MSIAKRVLVTIHDDGTINTQQFTESEFDEFVVGMARLIDGVEPDDAVSVPAVQTADPVIKVGCYYLFHSEGWGGKTDGIIRVTHIEDDNVTYEVVCGLLGDDDLHGFVIGSIFHHKLEKLTFKFAVGDRVKVGLSGRIGTVICIGYDDRSKANPICYGVEFDRRESYDINCSCFPLIVGKSGENFDCGWFVEAAMEDYDG